MATKSAAKKFLENLRKKKMDDKTTQDQDIRLDLDTPQAEVSIPEPEVVEEVTDVPAEESVEKKTEEVVEVPEGQPEEVVVEQPTGPDESYNCVPCQGSGLIIATGRICENCGGAGKI